MSEPFARDDASASGNLQLWCLECWWMLYVQVWGSQKTWQMALKHTEAEIPSIFQQNGPWFKEVSSFLAEVIMISTVPTGSSWLSNATTSGCYATHDQPDPSQRDQRWRACPLRPSPFAKAFFARALSSNLDIGQLMEIATAPGWLTTNAMESLFPKFTCGLPPNPTHKVNDYQWSWFEASNSLHVCSTTFPIHVVMTSVTWASTCWKPTVSSQASSDSSERYYCHAACFGSQNARFARIIV